MTRPTRIYARLDGTVQCIDIAAAPRVAWSTYIGAQIRQLAAGGAFLAAVGEHELNVLDRDSGELLCHVVLAGDEAPSNKHHFARFWRAAGTEAIASVCVSDHAVFVVSGGRFDARGTRAPGRLLWSRALKNERSFSGGLVAHDNVVVRVYSQGETFYATEYDTATGAELKTLPLEREQRFAMLARDTATLAARIRIAVLAVRRPLRDESALPPRRARFGDHAHVHA